MRRSNLVQAPSQDELKRRYDEAASRAASYVRLEYPRLEGILVHGSVARGEPGPFSDVDILAVTSRKRKPSEFSYFDEGIYVGVGFLSVAELKREFGDPKAFFWARGSAKATRILYDPRGILRGIMLRWKNAEPSYQILEKSLWDDYHNIIEYSGKLRNGWLKRDEYLTRYAARVIAQHVGRAIIALNDLSIISENYLWHQILNAKKRPQHLRTDYPVALGIKGIRETEMVYRSTMRLCKETLRLVRAEFGKKAKHVRFRALLAVALEKHGL
jgi:predicted nucleotidyltransferase